MRDGYGRGEIFRREIKKKTDEELYWEQKVENIKVFKETNIFLFKKLVFNLA